MILPTAASYMKLWEFFTQLQPCISMKIENSAQGKVLLDAKEGNV